MDGEKLARTPGSLKNLNALPDPQKQEIYRRLIPTSLLIDPRWWPPGGTEPLVNYVCPGGLGMVKIEIRRFPKDRDCLFFMEASDTPYGQLELTLCLMNDIEGQRYDIDRSPDGRDNCLGTLTRNIPEEIAAMNAGLCPHQILPGLGLFTDFFFRFEQFADYLGVDTIVAEPLSYNTAIVYENLGFDYLSGRGFMQWIDREFGEGGSLTARLNGSSPFRKTGMNRTVRGRSWAIHDGILCRSWEGIKIFKVVGQSAGIRTFYGEGW
jgi:hypothetical protein